MTFTAGRIPDQSGRVFVITGGNSGIGLASAHLLAARRATVVLACRDPRKAEVAAGVLRGSVPGADVQTVVLDLASLRSVRACADTLRDRFAKIDVLLNNAGVMAAVRVVTVSSLLHRRGELQLADIPRPARYDPKRQYAASKLSNLLFAYEFDRRLKRAGRPLISVACHPGYSATNLHRVGAMMRGSALAVAAGASTSGRPGSWGCAANR